MNRKEVNGCYDCCFYNHISSPQDCYWINLPEDEDFEHFPSNCPLLKDGGVLVQLKSDA